MRQTFAIAVTTALVLTGCSVSGSESDPTDGPETAGGTKTVTLVTHNSFSVPKKLLQAFEKKSGYRVKVSKSGDGGEVANKLVLTKKKPLGDVAFGIDNTYATRVAGKDVLTPYASPAMAPSAKEFLIEGKGAKELTPIDHASTCVNIDTTWFAKKNIAPPKTLGDLTKAKYKNLTVVPGAPTSSPGLAMLLATVGAYGESGWQGYWKKLVANGVKITSGWEDAYNVDFSQGDGKGNRPIVWSYDTSPAFTVKNGKTSSRALLDTCFRQVEYAGILKGAQNVKGAKALIDWMSGKTFQESLPENMYVFPVNDQITLPKDWANFAKQSSKPITVSPQKIDQNRTAWLRSWQEITSQ
ncbi:thiamine ABC transporter substrate-binding protein [Demetria terragena]|uniref:thiamine ABC transporter substrate-binding protein n=1 Tax=Demetria terragena TaxID=63959 RepID=UPI000379D0E3|nr:thiamine ABC transporter substrate-binding protein [Demetria terragena]